MKFKKTKYGQWEFPGENTLIPNANGNITMKGVEEPLLGIDDEGNSIMMMPGRDYQFPGNSVYEIPLSNLKKQLNPVRSNNASRINPWGFLVDPRQTRGNVIGGLGVNFPKGLGFSAVGEIPSTPDPVFKGMGSLGVSQNFGNLNIGANVRTPVLRDYYTRELIVDPELSFSGRYTIPYTDKKKLSGPLLEEGGEFMDMELTEDEAAEYAKGGYILEELKDGGPGNDKEYTEEEKQAYQKRKLEKEQAYYKRKNKKLNEYLAQVSKEGRTPSLEELRKAGFRTATISDDQYEAWANSQKEELANSNSRKADMISQYKKNMPWMSDTDIEKIVNNELNKSGNQSTVATYKKPRKLVFGEPGFKEQQRATNKQGAEDLKESVKQAGEDGVEFAKELTINPALRTWDRVTTDPFGFAKDITTTWTQLVGAPINMGKEFHDYTLGDGEFEHHNVIDPNAWATTFDAVSIIPTTGAAFNLGKTGFKSAGRRGVNYMTKKNINLSHLNPKATTAADITKGKVVRQVAASPNFEKTGFRTLNQDAAERAIIKKYEGDAYKNMNPETKKLLIKNELENAKKAAQKQFDDQVAAGTMKTEHDQVYANIDSPFFDPVTRGRTYNPLKKGFWGTGKDYNIYTADKSLLNAGDFEQAAFRHIGSDAQFGPKTGILNPKSNLYGNPDAWTRWEVHPIKGYVPATTTKNTSNMMPGMFKFSSDVNSNIIKFPKLFKEKQKFTRKGQFEQGGFIDAELTEKEAAEYLKGGYILEEFDEGGQLPKAQDGKAIQALQAYADSLDAYNHGLDIYEAFNIDNSRHLNKVYPYSVDGNFTIINPNDWTVVTPEEYVQKFYNKSTLGNRAPRSRDINDEEYSNLIPFNLEDPPDYIGKKGFLYEDAFSGNTAKEDINAYLNYINMGNRLKGTGLWGAKVKPIGYWGKVYDGGYGLGPLYKKPTPPLIDPRDIYVTEAEQILLPIKTLTRIEKEIKPTYKEAYKNVDKDMYPTLQDFIYAAKHYDKYKRNPKPEDLPSYKAKENFNNSANELKESVRQLNDLDLSLNIEPIPIPQSNLKLSEIEWGGDDMLDLDMSTPKELRQEKRRLRRLKRKKKKSKSRTLNKGLYKGKRRKKEEGGSVNPELGDIINIDKTTMERLKKLGYTLKEV